MAFFYPKSTMTEAPLVVIDKTEKKNWPEF